jgi:F420-dependent oxidoreductase-like protein
MRVSLNITNYSWPGSRSRLRSHLTAIAGAAEDAGLDTVWVADHLLQVDPRSTPEAAILEAYTTLGFLAAGTQRVRLGAMVSPVTYREPSLLIKAVTTLDVLSGGRAWLGLGAGYSEAEARALGLPLPPVPERFARLEETLQLAMRMWAGDTSAFHGAYYQLASTLISPQPVQRPMPQILVGGAGERRTLRLVAEYANACNLFDVPDGGETIKRKLEVLARHCARIQRPLWEIETTVSTRLGPDETAQVFAGRCRQLHDLGIEHAIVISDEAWTVGRLATLGSAAALVSQL